MPKTPIVRPGVDPRVARALGNGGSPLVKRGLGIDVDPRPAQALGYGGDPQVRRALGIDVDPRVARALGYPTKR